MPTEPLYPRFSKQLLLDAITDTPVVLIHGSRQCGKTTLAVELGEELGYHYLTFDDDTQRQAALTDPIGFIKSLPEFSILDEIQRVPELFTAIKTSVDTNRKPGRFILTGSANVLLLPKLADSLAGRMEIIRLHPLAQAELAGKPPSFLDQLFKVDFGSEINKPKYRHLGKELRNNLRRRLPCGPRKARRKTSYQLVQRLHYHPRPERRSRSIKHSQLGCIASLTHACSRPKCTAF